MMTEHKINSIDVINGMKVVYISVAATLGVIGFLLFLFVAFISFVKFTINAELIRLAVAGIVMAIPLMYELYLVKVYLNRVKKN